MIEKVSGRVAYAVMSFGGFLGLGAEEHAVPWKKLTYDTRRILPDITEQQLRGAPVTREIETTIGPIAAERELHDYYRSPYYWDPDRH